MESMKVLKVGLAVVVTAFIIDAGTIAQANNVLDGTYVFTATDGNTVFNASTVTFAGDGIASWNLVESDTASQYGWLPPGYGYPGLFPPLTPGNSSVISLTTFANGTGPNAFAFSIGSPNGVGSTGNSIFWFEGQNNLNGVSSLYGSATFNQVVNDPIGIWQRVGTVSVPDASGTFVLLALALAALGTGKSFLHRQAAA